MKPTGKTDHVEARYFSSPRDAVAIISALLKREDFFTLASYYDLSGSAIEREELTSGDFFLRIERPAMAHSAGYCDTSTHFFPDFNTKQYILPKGKVIIRW